MRTFKEFRNQTKKTVVATFGDFQTPVAGHQKLFDSLSEQAKGAGEYKIFVSQDQDGTEKPLMYEEKIKFMRKMFPVHARNILKDNSVNSILDVAVRAFKEGATEFIFMGREDQITEATSLLNRNNGVSGEHGLYEFRDGVRVIPFDENSPNTKTVIEAAQKGDLDGFSKEMPSGFSEATDLLNAIRRGIGLKENYNFRRHTDLPKLSDVRERYAQGDIFNEGDLVIKGTSELTVTERKPNFVVCEDICGIEQKCWLEDIQPAQSIDEGVDDPAIFKAVFMAGGPGSGKSYTLGKVGLNTMGFRILNSDLHFERALKKAAGRGSFGDMSPKDVLGSPEALGSKRAQRIRNWISKPRTAKQRDLWIDGRLGIVVDGTGKNFNKIRKQANDLKEMGYEVAMLFVNTNLETALERNEMRERKLKRELVIDSWNEVQNNLGAFQQFFGNNFSIIDNSEGAGAKFNKQTSAAFKKFQAFASKKPSDWRAKAWIKMMAGEDKRLLKKFGIVEGAIHEESGNYQKALDAYLDFIRDQWDQYNERRPGGIKTQKDYEVEKGGRNYDRVVVIEPGGHHRSVHSFVAKKDIPNKGFVEGDILKPASWKAPATNFARGNIYRGADPKNVSWISAT